MKIHQMLLSLGTTSVLGLTISTTTSADFAPGDPARFLPPKYPVPAALKSPDEKQEAAPEKKPRPILGVAISPEFSLPAIVISAPEGEGADAPEKARPHPIVNVAVAPNYPIPAAINIPPASANEFPNVAWGREDDPVYQIVLAAGPSSVPAAINIPPPVDYLPAAAPAIEPEPVQIASNTEVQLIVKRPGSPAVRALDLTPGQAAEPTEETVEYGAPVARVDDPLDYIENASELMEFEIQDEDGERLGTFNDIVIDKQSGQIEFVAVGPEEPFRLVPPQALEPEPEDNQLRLALDSDRWEDAPTASRDELARLASTEEAREIYSFYGLNHRASVAQTERAKEGEPEEAIGPREDLETARLPGDPPTPRAQPPILQPDPTEIDEEPTRDYEYGTPRGRATRNAEEETGAPEAEEEVEESSPSMRNPRLGQTHRGSDRSPRQPFATDPGPAEFGAPGERKEELAQQDRLIWASDLLGHTVNDRNEQPVGEIVDLIVDLHVGYLQHVIVAQEGPEGQRFALPLRDLAIEPEGKIILQRDLATLESAPAYDARTARLRRYDPFRYDLPEAPQYGAPARDEKSEAKPQP